MGITTKIGQVFGQMQDGVKSSSKSLFGLILKIVTGFFFGLTFALIGQEVFQYGTLLFAFTMILTGAVIFRLVASWTLVSTLVFDLIAVLVALLLRMYVLMAP